MKKQFIFDMDGTILDSMFYWDSMAYEFLNSLGVNPPENINDEIRHMTVRECGEHFKNRFSIDLTAEEIQLGTVKLMREKYKKDILPKPDVIAFLEQAKALGIPMCIATATKRELADIVVKRLGLEKYFQFTITTDEVGKSKRHPDIYTISAQRLGGKIADTVVFEDAPHCMVTAFKAGFTVVGIWDSSFVGNDKLIMENSHYYFKNFSEIMESDFLKAIEK